MLFILHLKDTASSLCHLKNKSHSRINYFRNNGAREMEFSLLNGGDVGEYSGVGFVKMYKILGMHANFSIRCCCLTVFIKYYADRQNLHSITILSNISTKLIFIIQEIN